MSFFSYDTESEGGIKYLRTLYCPVLYDCVCSTELQWFALMSILTCFGSFRYITDAAKSFPSQCVFNRGLSLPNQRCSEGLLVQVGLADGWRCEGGTVG